eukprot:m.43030 g.43030  ORF g.43030 m.43030 type:complete len:1224 (-) comp6130_c0_seq1:59-3730(-)
MLRQARRVLGCGDDADAAGGAPSSSGSENSEGQNSAPWTVTVGTAHEEAVDSRRRKRLENKIRTNKYTPLTFLPRNLFEQFHRYANLFFLFIAVIAMIPATQALNPETAAAPLLTVLLVTAIRDYFEDRKRARSDRALNEHRAHVLRNGRIDDDIQWQEIMVGDVVLVRMDEDVPADLLVLSTSDPSGHCYIETANLDGETNLKVRESHPATGSKFREPASLKTLDAELVTSQPDNNLFHLDGRLKIRDDSKAHPFAIQHVCLRGVTLRNTEWIYGAVIYAGHNTKVMQNILMPRMKRTIVDRLMNIQILGVFLMLAVMCTILAIYSSSWARNDLPDAFYINEEDSPTTTGIVTFFAFVLLLHSLVPLSCYVSVELCKLAQARFVNEDLEMYDEATDTPAQARTSALSDELGMVRYLLSDKTGTITQNLMVFLGASINGQKYGSDLAVGEAISAVSHFNDCPHSHEMKGFRDLRLHEDIRRKDGDPTYTFFMMTLALCNEAIPHRHTGGSLEVDGAEEFHAQSPDEIALAEAARDLGWSVFDRDNNNRLTVNVFGKVRKFQTLNIIDFSSERKRMSVIVELLPSDGSDAADVDNDWPLTTGGIYVLSKGADEVMLPLMAKGQVNPEVFGAAEQHLDDFAREGLRTLVFGSKQISRAEYEEWSKKWDSINLDLHASPERKSALVAEIESNLSLVGVSAVDDKLQDYAPETIAALKRANISVWVLTGDKQETAISIGRAIRLLTPDLETLILNAPSEDKVHDVLQRAAERVNLTCDPTKRATPEELSALLPSKPFAVVVDGATLRFIFKSAEARERFANLAAPSTGIICCRSAPLQKAQVVKLVRNRFNAVTLAIGDGANDVSMIKEADVGVGISGLEGRQAVLASDYAIAKFGYLRRLLFVHGRWSYNRITLVVLYFFYKNYAYILVNFWFAWFSVASAQTIYDQRYIMLYNIFFTSVPGIVLGMVDQDVSAEAAMRYPELYRDSQANSLFSHKIFWLWVLDSFYQSLVCFGVPLLAMANFPTDGGRTWNMWEIGTIMYTAVVIVVNLKLLMEAQYWTRLLIITVVVSILSYFVFLLIYHSILPDIVSSFGAVFNLFGDSVPWWTLFLTIFLALLPSFVIKLIRITVRPTAAQIVREREYLQAQHKAARDNWAHRSLALHSHLPGSLAHHASLPPVRRASPASSTMSSAVPSQRNTPRANRSSLARVHSAPADPDHERVFEQAV